MSQRHYIERTRARAERAQTRAANEWPQPAEQFRLNDVFAAERSSARPWTATPSGSGPRMLMTYMDQYHIGPVGVTTA